MQTLPQLAYIVLACCGPLEHDQKVHKEKRSAFATKFLFFFDTKLQFSMKHFRGENVKRNIGCKIPVCRGIHRQMSSSEEMRAAKKNYWTFHFSSLLMFANCARDFIFIYSFALAYASLHECCCCCLLVLSFIVSLSRISLFTAYLASSRKLLFLQLFCVVCACSFIYFYSLSLFLLYSITWILNVSWF